MHSIQTILFLSPDTCSNIQLQYTIIKAAVWILYYSYLHPIRRFKYSYLHRYRQLDFRLLTIRMVGSADNFNLCLLFINYICSSVSVAVNKTKYIKPVCRTGSSTWTIKIKILFMPAKTDCEQGLRAQMRVCESVRCFVHPLHSATDNKTHSVLQPTQ